MSENNKSYRIRTNVDKDSFLNIKLDQDYENFEFLTLNLSRENIYKLHTSNYGCIAGRVLANDAFGIPNAKVSVFVPSEESEDIDPILRGLYPYNKTSNENSQHIRYNVLPDSVTDDICHQDIGTFPNKRLVLDDNNVLEIYEKYYKYTTVTNDAGDYMIFGVPVGQQTVHVDIDLSDIGRLSQTPRDMIFKGYDVNQFESTSKFKKDTNLDALVQVISENSSINVQPFWGEDSEATVAITRNDIKVRYKFETYCVFMGSVITDGNDDYLSKRCIPTDGQGKMDRVGTGQGTIEMIRKTADGGVEALSIQGTKLIDGSGTWCYQIPMNLDYVGTDEYGNIVATNDPTKGIPTRTEVRFRLSMLDKSRETHHLPKVLIPNNPKSNDELDYTFGSYTKDTSFKHLFYNNVYTIKSFIPRIQKGNNQFNKRFTGIKTVNAVTDNNRFPYNNMRVQVKFMFVLMCAILKMLIRIVRIVNKWRSTWKRKNCIVLGDGLCPDLEGWYFAPGCNGEKMLERTLKNIESDEGEGGDVTTGITEDSPDQITDNSSVDSLVADDNVCLTGKITYLLECVEINLAMEYDVINFDFYNDWVNGTVYIPKWYGDIRRKQSFLFGLIKVKEKIRGCLEDSVAVTRRYTQQCALEYRKKDDLFYDEVASSIGCKSDSKYQCHKAAGRKQVKVLGKLGGIVHKENTLREDKVFYLKPCEFQERYGNYWQRVIFFATDIVLLGSLSKRNDDGIPMIYGNIPSTTYQLPTNLAATNMDSEAYNFATSDETACSGKKLSDVTRTDNTAAAYNKWSQGTDDPETDTEAAVTEASGIDWGYDGPDQYKNRNSLYLPSGHFLGIGCAVAETNIKSCVNLSRVCEIGAEMSQRHEMVSSVTADGIKYKYIAPSGLINKYDISDSNYRRIFATLNYNGLKVKKDEETQYNKYDFVSSMVSGFDGVLARYVSDNTDYNNPLPVSGETVFYRQTDEAANNEYYRYRLGVKSDEYEEIESKYLIHNGSYASMPVYENSYYFYFGLNNGQTAYDRLLNDYYSVCQRDENYIPTLDFDASTSSVGCDSNGTAKFSVTNYNGVYSIRIYKFDENGGGNYLKFKVLPSTDDIKEFTVNNSGYTNYNTKVKNFRFNGLDSGKYNVSITTYVDKIEYSRTFEILDEAPSELEDINVGVIHFSKEIYNNTDTYVQNGGGYLYFNLSSGQTGGVPSEVARIDVFNYNGYKDTWYRGVPITSQNIVIKSGNILRFYVRDGNSRYYVTYGLLCSDGSIKNYTMSNGYYVKMDAPLDFYVGTKMVTGRQLTKAGADASIYTGSYNSGFTSWVFNAMATTSFTETQKWIIERAVVNSDKPDENMTHAIPCGYCLGQGAPYDLPDVRGHGEKIGATKYVMSDGLDTSIPPRVTQILPDMKTGDWGYSVSNNNFRFSNAKLSSGGTRLECIKYNTDKDYKDLCQYGLMYNGGMPYKITFNGLNSGGTDTKYAVLPSINIPMYAYVTYWLDDTDSQGQYKKDISVDFSVNGGTGFKVKNDVGNKKLWYSLGDLEIKVSDDFNNNEKKIVANDGTTGIEMSVRRKSRLLSYDTGKTEATAEYNMTGITLSTGTTITASFDLKEGSPLGFTDFNGMRIKTLKDERSCKFYDEISYLLRGNVQHVNSRVLHITSIEGTSDNVRYYAVNKRFLEKYHENVALFGVSGLCSNFVTLKPVNSSVTMDNTCKIWEIDNDNIFNFSCGIVDPNVQYVDPEGTGDALYVIGVSNNLTDKNGSLYNQNDDIYKAFVNPKQYMNPLDNNVTLIKIYRNKRTLNP